MTLGCLVVMTANYQNDLGDLLALNRLLEAERARGRRNKKLLVFAVGLVLAGGAVGWGAVPLSSSWPLLGFVAAMAAVAFTLGPALERRSLDKEVHQTWQASGRHLGHQQLHLTEEAIVHRSSRGELRHAWSEVRRVARTDAHLFLFLGEAEALVVPGRALGADRLTALHHAAEERWRAARG